MSEIVVPVTMQIGLKRHARPMRAGIIPKEQPAHIIINSDDIETFVAKKPCSLGADQSSRTSDNAMLIAINSINAGSVRVDRGGRRATARRSQELHSAYAGASKQRPSAPPTIADIERDVGITRLDDSANLNTFPRKLLAELRQFAK